MRDLTGRLPQASLENIQQAFFLVDLQKQVEKWQLDPSAQVALYDAWRLLPSWNLRKLFEQACRDSAGGGLPWNDERTFYEVRFSWPDFHERAREAVRDALHSSFLTSEGFAAGARPNTRKTPIHRERWGGATPIEWERCALGFEGQLITEIVVRRADTRMPDTDRPPPASQQGVDGFVRSWVLELQSKGEEGSQERAWKAAQEHFPERVRRTQVIEAYRRFAPENWKRQGRRKAR